MAAYPISAILSATKKMFFAIHKMLSVVSKMSGASFKTVVIAKAIFVVATEIFDGSGCILLAFTKMLSVASAIFTFADSIFDELGKSVGTTFKMLFVTDGSFVATQKICFGARKMSLLHDRRF